MKIYRLEETTDIPGSRDKKTLKTFSTRKKADNWLTVQGYEEIKRGRPRWERQSDQESMFDVWVYVEIKEEELE